jgi:hypothetical protein
MRAAVGCLAIVLCWTLADGCARRPSLGSALSDREFWSLIDELSEPAGTFSVSDNFVSNEPHVAENVRWLRPSGGVYIGVGPEQNFSYVARMRPAMAFILDIRRENQALHFFYKALFELSADRADFVSRLFSRPRPASLTSTAGVDEIFTQFAGVQASRDLYDRTRTQVRDLLLTTHHLPLSPTDLAWIDRAFGAFYADGPDIQFWGSRTVEALHPTYAQLMTARDLTGQSRSFLATDQDFQFVKDLQARNLIVPVVGDFGGPTAMRRIGDYVRGHSTAVRAFYGSNVSVYLNAAQTHAFCASLTALPAATGAWCRPRNAAAGPVPGGRFGSSADGSARRPR